MKSIAKEKWEVWMERDDEEGRPNWERWEKKKMTMSDKRILMTWIFGDSWSELCGKKYAHFRRAAFEKGGVAVTASGKNAHLIKVDNHGPVWPGAPGYVSE